MASGWSSLLAGLALVATPVAAQEVGESQVTFTMSPTFIRFSLGQGFAAAAHLRVDRLLSERAAVGVSAFAMLPFGGASAEPDCPPLVSCVSLATPHLLTGLMASGYSRLRAAGLRASVGVGVVAAHGGRGPGRTSSLAGLVGLDWESSRSSRLRPTIGVRYLRTASPLYGARDLLIPGLGFGF
jgi:hypothetical protein